MSRLSTDPEPAGPHFVRPEGSNVVGGAARRFETLGLLDEAGPLLEAVGWDPLAVDAAWSALPRAHDIGSAYERALGLEYRRGRGIHYTPPLVAAGLTRLVLGHRGGPVRVADPACGSGAFLVAAAEALRCRGLAVGRIVADHLFGSDLDPYAIALARVAVALWAADHTRELHVVPDGHVVVADGLAIGDGDRSGWGRPMDVVLGNPPFGSQMKGAAVRDPMARKRLETRFGLGPIGTVDTAALFLLEAIDLVRPEGVVGLVLPTSVAATRGARVVREAVGERASIVEVWIDGGDVGFDAAVSVWAPVLRVGRGLRTSEPIPRFRGDSFEPVDDVDLARDTSRWSPLVATGPGIGSLLGDEGFPPGDVVPTLDSVASATAGFRQHFYGLAPHVHDDPDGDAAALVLVTTGAIDPLRHRTDLTVRFAGMRFVRPVVDVRALRAADGSLADWVEALHVPKVLVASQGRVVEAIVDPDGTLVPSTPVIAVVPDPGSNVSLWHLAALLSAPRSSATLHREAAGTGIGPTSCRVTAGFVGSLPLPFDRRAWDTAASSAHDAHLAAAKGDHEAWNRHLDGLADAMSGAYETDPSRVDPTHSRTAVDLVAWWREQRPGWHGGVSNAPGGMVA